MRNILLVLMMGLNITWSQMISYHSDSTGEIMGYLSKPKTNTALPGIILIHEWWGLNQDIKNKADEFAKKGYVALAVDLYQGKSTASPKKARNLAGRVRNNMNEAFENLESALDFLKSLDNVNKNKLASVGWCFGGGWSYQVAKNNLDVKASIIYYGRFNPEDDLSIMRANILGHFAEKDRGIKIDNVKEFQVKLNTLNGEHEIYIYPNTMHGFASRPNDNNSAFDKAASDEAWRRTIVFLEKTFSKY